MSNKDGGIAIYLSVFNFIRGSTINMRIISGKYKSLKIEYPKSQTVRPTMDRVKESMFNMIGPNIIDASVLSIFSGSGSLGLEALSRGAKHCVFVDIYQESIGCIERNINKLHVPAGMTEVIRADGVKSIESFHRQNRSFDYIFIDPPYYKDYIKKTLLNLERFDILAPFSHLVIEHAKDEPLPSVDFVEIVKHKHFGATYVTICKKVS